jgi:hypothetical protein
MVSEYPKQGKPTHPDDVGKRRMPARQIAENDENSLVKYSVGAKGGMSKLPPTRDLGEALKQHQSLKRLYPKSDFEIKGE